MAAIDVRDPTGKVLGQRELPSGLFDAPVNGSLMHQVVVAGQAAQRAGTHSTKTRGEVRGGGDKPWRQKGTGRARHGSIRSPIWMGGGVAHGPKPRDYSMRVNKKMKRAALRSALTDAAQSDKLALVSELRFEEPATKEAAAVLEALGLEGKILLVLAAPDEMVLRSFRNLRHVKVDYPGNLSTYDVLFADRILFTIEALDVLSGEDGQTIGDQAGEPEGSEPTGEAEGGDSGGSAEGGSAEGGDAEMGGPEGGEAEQAVRPEASSEEVGP